VICERDEPRRTDDCCGNCTVNGLLIINHAYNEGKLTFKEWMELSREWALKIKEQHKGRAA
jgi:hypothetical protein